MKLDRVIGTNKCFNALHISDNEALDLIKSLASQLRSKDPNVGRLEFVAKVNGENEYFSLFVVDAKDTE